MKDRYNVHYEVQVRSIFFLELLIPTEVAEDDHREASLSLSLSQSTKVTRTVLTDNTYSSGSRTILRLVRVRKGWTATPTRMNGNRKKEARIAIGERNGMKCPRLHAVRVALSLSLSSLLLRKNYTPISLGFGTAEGTVSAPPLFGSDLSLSLDDDPSSGLSKRSKPNRTD